MSMKQTEIVAALAAELDGAPGIGDVIRGALSEVDSQLTSSESCAVAIEYGACDPIAPINQRRTAQFFDQSFRVYTDFYWSGPPAVWEARIFDDAYAEAWRRIMDDLTFGSTVAGILRIQPDGHDEPELNTEGDRQHVVVRATWVFEFRTSVTNPEA